jgi:ribosomal protein S18 acetylase RimI-like enzyme
MSMVQIVLAESAAQLADVRRLLEEYWRSFGFTPCFQGFADEVAGLPGSYAPPGGRLAITMVGGEPAGCVALRRIDRQRCEAKRGYVRPQFRRYGLGRQLMEWVVAAGRAAGYSELLADTMPAMQTALVMYERAGFERVRPYSENATEGAIYLRLAL